MTEIAVAPAPLDVALLKAVGLDRAAPEQRQLAINIAQRYELDLLLKHLVLIEGRPYLTRDALLHIAHRSGQFDGIGTTTPEVVGDEWRCTATVWRKDMSHPFVYGGRYPAKGGNQKFAPEMAIKVAESMALRRAFNVAAPVAEERWDVEAQPEPPARPSLAERAAAKATEIAQAPRVELLDREDDGFTALMTAAPPILVTDRPDGILNVEEVAEGAPAVYVGLSVETLKDLCVKAGKSTVAIAKVIECGPDQVGVRVKAMSPVERGVLATELGIEWGS